MSVDYKKVLPKQSILEVHLKRAVLPLLSLGKLCCVEILWVLWLSFYLHLLLCFIFSFQGAQYANVALCVRLYITVRNLRWINLAFLCRICGRRHTESFLWLYPFHCYSVCKMLFEYDCEQQQREGLCDNIWCFKGVTYTAGEENVIFFVHTNSYLI